MLALLEVIDRTRFATFDMIDMNDLLVYPLDVGDGAGGLPAQRSSLVLRRPPTSS